MDAADRDRCRDGRGMTAPRFVVSAITGYRFGGNGSRPPGTTFAVHDRAYCYRDVAVFATERETSRLGRSGMHARAERRARALADRLNAEYAPLTY
jgi:hypothetical protein